MKQEVTHGRIVADIIRSLGEDPFNDKWVGQYAFKMPLECWCDVAWFQACDKGWIICGHRVDG